MSWQAATWALTVAPMPKADAAARAVLAYLAVKADGNGRNAFPLALSIAHDVGLNPEVVPRVLKRLVDFGLISKDGVGPQGQPKWTLHMDRQHSAGSFEEFCLRHRASAAARKARYRSGDVHDEQSGTVHDSESGTVHDHESGTGAVHDSGSSCPGSTVVMSTTLDPDVHDSESPQISPTKVLDQSGDQSTTDAVAPAETDLLFDVPATKPATPKPSTTDLDADFDRFWANYPRKDNKANARKVWPKVAKKHGAEVLISEAERWAQLWAAAGRDKGYMPMPTTWLNGERWTDEPPAPRSANGNGQHVPYRNPVDQSVYDEPLI